jgi:predicted patatin/cPLA2 family phospholipase
MRSYRRGYASRPDVSCDLTKALMPVNTRPLHRANKPGHVQPEQDYPLDFDTYFKSKDRFVMVTSNCLTGKAEYFEEKKDKNRLVDICCASCSLPVLCPVAYVDGIPMVDGGVCDAIPIQRAIDDGFHKNVVILTRNKGYRKKDKDFYLPGFIYKQYPAIREQLKVRYKRYNEVLDYIDQLEAEGKVFVIRPENKIEVGRTESNTEKLEALYEEGYALAERLVGAAITAAR